MPSHTQENAPHHAIIRKPGLAADAPIVVVVTGQHGNEPMGLELGWQMAAAYKMAETCRFELRLFGGANPWGLRHLLREMEDGRDMNATWGGPDACRDDLEREVWSVLRSGRRVLLLDMHSQSGTLPLAYYDGPLGQALEPLFRSLPFVCKPKAGCLTGACEAHGVEALTIEATSGQPLGLLPQIVWKGASQWAERG